MPYRKPMLAQSVNSMMDAMFGNPQAELAALGTAANARRAAAAASLDEQAFGARAGARDAVMAGGLGVPRALVAQGAADPRGLGTVAPSLMSAYGGTPEVAALLGEQGMGYLANMTGTQAAQNTFFGQGRDIAGAADRARIAAGPGHARVAELARQFDAGLVPTFGEDGRVVMAARGGAAPASVVPGLTDVQAAAANAVLGGSATLDVAEIGGATQFVRGQMGLLNTRASGEEARALETLEQAGAAADDGRAVELAALEGEIAQAEIRLRAALEANNADAAARARRELAILEGNLARAEAITRGRQDRETVDARADADLAAEQNAVVTALLPNGETRLTTAGDALAEGALDAFGLGQGRPSGGGGAAGGGSDLTDFSTADRKALAQTVAAVAVQMGAPEIDPRLTTQVVAEAQRVALARSIDIYRALDEVLARLEVEETGGAWRDGEFASRRLVLRPEGGPAAASPEADAVLGGGVDAEAALAEARDAIARGADRAQVAERLRSFGIDPGRL